MKVTDSPASRMTKSAYAAHRQRVPSSVTAWIKRGLIVMDGNLVDVEASDALLDAHLDPGRGAKAAEPAPERRTGRPPGPPSTLATAAAADRDASRQLKELRLKREQRELIDGKATIQAIEQAFGITKEVMGGMAVQIGATAAAEMGVNPHPLMNLIDREVREHNKRLAEALQKIADDIQPDNAPTFAA
jgi:hypothetical protein